MCSSDLGINRVAVAEMAMALVLDLARRVTQQDRMIHQGVRFNRNHYWGMEVSGKTVGVVGMGNIGTEFARKMHAAFGCSLLGYDPWASAERWHDIPHTRVTSLDALWPACDIISLHVPYTPDNHHLVNARALSLMKPHALLVNVSRGGLIDEPALYDALQQGQLAAAALDVWQEVEPPPADHPLLQLPQVIATPHAAGSTWETQAASSLAVAQQLWQVFVKEDAPLVEVNPLVKTPDGVIMALDGKVTIDENAEFRQPHHTALVDLSAVAPKLTDSAVVARDKVITLPASDAE